MAAAAAKGIVAIGDSITDGRGTTPTTNNRWTDHPGRAPAGERRDRERVDDESGHRRDESGWRPARRLQARFARDVLGQSGVKYVIVLDGVNDIDGGADLIRT